MPGRIIKIFPATSGDPGRMFMKREVMGVESLSTYLEKLEGTWLSRYSKRRYDLRLRVSAIRVKIKPRRSLCFQ